LATEHFQPTVFGVIVAALISALATVVAAFIQSRKREQD
jgi:hypothetical protein